jgi:hypothetical protein
MSSARAFIAVLSLAAALLGCAGKDFVRPSTDALKLGQTTHAQVVQQFGQPRREGTVLKNDKTLKVLSYAYASIGGEALHSGVVAARGMTYYFYNDVLVGYGFISSWKEDNTDFDEKKVEMIVKGRSSRADVVALMGKPSGYYVYPMIKTEPSEAIVYNYVEARLDHTAHRKSLAVSFDSNDVVTEVEYIASDGQ